jgi:hypothetical protein
MKQSVRLPGPPIDGHGAANEVIGDFGELDSQVLDHRSRTAGIQFLH